MRQRVRGFQRGKKSLETSNLLKRLQRLIVRHPRILCPLQISQPRMLRTNSRVIQTSRHRVSWFDVSMSILKKQRARPLQNPHGPPRESRGMAAWQDPVTTRFNPKTRDDSANGTHKTNSDIVLLGNRNISSGAGSHNRYSRMKTLALGTNISTQSLKRQAFSTY